MQVFVTGASGFIGSAVAGAFARAGHDVRGLVRSSDKARALALHEIEPIIGTMEDPASYAAAAESSTVLVHCAAEYSARYMALDKQTVETLTWSAQKSNAPRTLLYTSGVWIYGDTGASSVDESSPLNPPPNVATRAEHERIVLSSHSGNLRTLVLRPGCVYGGSGSLTALWFESAVKSGTARYVGSGEQRWAMVHLDDLAALYVLAAESALGGRVLNATDHSRFTIAECARAASRAAGADGRTQSIPPAEAQKSFGPMARCLEMTQHVDSSRAARLLGWQPRSSGFVDGAERYFRAWRASTAS
jgi:nucleoside-diphosphate-sugar epimerase